MAGPLESTLGFFIPEDPLFELEAKLDDVLSHIAFEDFNADYVKRVSKELAKWEDFVKINLDFSGESFCESPTLLALHCLRNAYYGFMYPYYKGGWEDVSPEARQEDAKEILGEECFLGADFVIPLSCAIRTAENKGYDVIGWSVDSGGKIDLEYEKY